MTKVCLFFVILLSAISSNAQVQVSMNQLGYYPSAPKIAVIVSDTAFSQFTISSAETKSIILKGKPGLQQQSQNSSHHTQVADFSKLTTPGTYVFSLGPEVSSQQFIIRSQVHQAVGKASLKAFYFQRVSMPLTERYAGAWARTAGHPDTSVIIHPSARNVGQSADTILSAPGGWYDAGDYNKYIVNSGITMGTLMSAWEDFTWYFDTLNVDIPESNNRLPDLLDEVIYNLRWMLLMQDKSDGGVYHKLTNAAFDGNVMPGVTKLPRYVVQKSTTAALDFSAVTAQAARIFKAYSKQLPGLSDSCLDAAKRAWNWALKNPSVNYNQDSMNLLFEPKITTGTYGDRRYDDEWFWAAAELAVTTGGEVPEYVDKFFSALNNKYSLPTWSNVYMSGIYSLNRYRIKNSQTKLARQLNVTGNIGPRLTAMADEYLSLMSKNAFLTVMGGRRSDFNWGSNSNAANQGIVLINAWLETGKVKYINAALANLDYILGRNATGYCFVTGFGRLSPKHPHHRPSEADGVEAPVPGLLAGGPNPGMQDKCEYPFKEPETAYVDANCSYASNEIAINWNAPLVYLANAIEALQSAAGYSKVATPTSKRF